MQVWDKYWYKGGFDLIWWYFFMSLILTGGNCMLLFLLPVNTYKMKVYGKQNTINRIYIKYSLNFLKHFNANN